MQLAEKRMGTTLLELTVATMVILLVVVFMTSIWVSHARITGKSRQRTTALIAEFTMEEWAAKGWKAASQDALVPALADGHVSVSTKMGLNPEFVMPYTFHVATLEDPDPLKAPLVGVLQVTVQFPGERSDSTFKEIRYETYLSKPAP